MIALVDRFVVGTRPTHAGARGMTLIELMIGLAVTMLFVSGVILFLIGHTRTSRRNLDRSDIQHGGRSALSLISQEIGTAGLGLPRELAIRSFTTSGAQCSGTPELEIASLDFLREWTVLTPAASSLTLASATPAPTTVADTTIASGEWVFFFQNPRFTSASRANGYGLLAVGGPRLVGGNVVSIAATDYSAVAPKIDLGQVDLVNSTPHAPVMLRARVSRFGVNCIDDPAHPYLYWLLAGQNQVPLARNADTRMLTADDRAIDATAGQRVALRFLFYVDADADGKCDDRNGDGVFSRADALTAPAAADFANVCAIEVLMRLRNDEPEAGTGLYRTVDFVELIETTGINTRNPSYIFIDNLGL